MQRHFADYEVIRHLSAAVPWPYPEDGARRFIGEQVMPAQGRDRWVWGIHLREAEGLIGVVDLWREGHPEHRGFWLGRTFWGRGYMTEAVIPVTGYAFDALDFERLIFNNAVGNRRSRAIKVKTGARLIDVVAAKFIDPAYTHQEIWELTRKDWRRS